MKVYICQICGNGFTGRKKKYCSQDCSDEARRIKNRERWREANPGWNDGTNKVCEWCGKGFTVPKRNAHIARFCSEKCNSTWWGRTVYGYKPIEERNEERRKQKLIRQNRLEKERLVNTVKRSIQSVIKFKEEELKIKELTRNCIECDDLFYNPSPNVLTCTTECSHKRNNRISREKYKGRINKDNLVDKNISLNKLYKKDKGMCYICGEQCDWNDKVVTDKGHTIVGSNYPSIEHVIPLSKGGKHSWDNVKLACMRCNTLKSNKIEAVGNKALNT